MSCFSRGGFCAGCLTEWTLCLLRACAVALLGGAHCGDLGGVCWGGCKQERGKERGEKDETFFEFQCVELVLI